MIVIHTYRRINGEFCNIGKGEWVLQTENWVCEVIKEIRLNCQYTLQKQLIDKEKQLEEREKEKKIAEQLTQEYNKKNHM